MGTEIYNVLNDIENRFWEKFNQSKVNYINITDIKVVHKQVRMSDGFNVKSIYTIFYKLNGEMDCLSGSNTEDLINNIIDEIYEKCNYLHDEV